MKLRVGKIPFLVCVPFFHRFLEENRHFEAFSFVEGVPSALNQKLWSGEIHLAPASSIAYAKDPCNLRLVPDICTSCNLEVHSVELFSRFPLENLSHKKVYLTRQSGTSVALFRILCSQYAQVHPEYVDAAENADAILLIGDEALLEKSQNRWPFRYDLAKLWESWQGLPFVFGAWSVHQSALSNELRPLLDYFLSNVRESISTFRADPASALTVWTKRYEVPFSMGQLQAYYNSLDYEFTDERKRSLEIYFNLCAKEGILPYPVKLQFF